MTSSAMSSQSKDSDALVTYLGRRRARPLTCLGDVGELGLDRSSGFDKAMPSDYPVRMLPRKWWEWDYIADCAETLGIMKNNATALGLGVGDEPLIFYFARSFGKVIATDLYSSDTAWKEARFSEAERVLNTSPIDYPRDRVSVQNADMRSTGVPDKSVDMVWSCSSIEHIPTLADLFLVFREINRVLKPGGHAILTTEFCVTQNNYLLPGVNAWNADIVALMSTCLPGFSWLGPKDLGFNSLHPGNAARPRRYLPFSALPACSHGISYNHRAGTLANPVGLSIIVPIAFVIQKKAEVQMPSWEEAPVEPWLRQFTDGLSAFHEGDNETARDKLDEVYHLQKNDIQTRHICFRFSIDARARLGEQENKGRFADLIHNFVDSIPNSPVQDADCLDICGYLLGECGDYQLALKIYEYCLHSPSTSRDHVFELVIRYLSLAQKCQAVEHAVPIASSILADLFQFGLQADEYQRAFLTPAKKQVSSRLVKAVDQETRRIIATYLRGLQF